MKNLYYPENLNNQDLNPAFIQLAYFERDDIDRLMPISVISLGMPENISQPSTVSWDNEKFGMGGKIVAEGLKKVFTDGGTMDTSSMIEAVAQRVKQTAAFNVAAKAANFATGSSATAEGLMGEVAGRVPNPYVTAIFRGINFRSFDYTFRFTPFTEKDCDLIDAIIKEMRTNALGESIDSTAFFSYPRECQIAYYWKGKENKWLNKFKRAACTKIDVNYTSGGSYTAMRNGFPTQVIVNTSWTELDLVVRQDIAGGF